MAQSPKSVEYNRKVRYYIFLALAKDVKALRPDRPRIRTPITHQCEAVFETLIFAFQNAESLFCNPSISSIADTTGCCERSVQRHLNALRQTEFLSWRHGKRKRVRTRKGDRIVCSSNEYRIFCPRRHLKAVRCQLIRASGGKNGPEIQAALCRFTPPTEEARACAEVVQSMAADLHPRAPRPVHPAGHDPPVQTPPGAKEGELTEVAGMRVCDPRGALARLWDALERRGD